MLFGIFVGLPLVTDGRYSDDLLIVDVEELAMAVSGREVYTHRVKAKEVVPAKSWPGQGKFEFYVFPLAGGSVTPPDDDPRREDARHLDVIDIGAETRIEF